MRCMSPFSKIPEEGDGTSSKSIGLGKLVSKVISLRTSICGVELAAGGVKVSFMKRSVVEDEPAAGILMVSFMK